MFILCIYSFILFVFVNVSIFESSRTPSQPPSPLLPYGEGYQPYLFRRWSAHTHTYGIPGGGSIVGPPGVGSVGGASGTNYSSIGGYGSGSSLGGGGAGLSSSSTSSSGGHGFPSAFLYNSRRWSVPASASQQTGSTTGFISLTLLFCLRSISLEYMDPFFFTDSGRRTEPSDLDYGLLDAINLLSTKPPNLRDIPLEESRGEYMCDEDDEPQTTSLWPPSDNMPGNKA
jgi:hypothetical protein